MRNGSYASGKCDRRRMVNCHFTRNDKSAKGKQFVMLPVANQDNDHHPSRPAHVILVLLAQTEVQIPLIYAPGYTPMLTYPAELLYFHNLCMREANALVHMRRLV